MATQKTGHDRFAPWIVGGILAVVLAGFSRSFFLLPLFDGGPAWAAAEPIFYIHGFVFGAWFLLLAVQTYLVRTGSLRLHRCLGYAGTVLGSSVVIIGSYAAIRAANRPSGFMGILLPPRQFLIVPLLSMALFATFSALAVVNRANAASHKRLILLAAISLLGAPVTRLTLMIPVLPGWIIFLVYSAFIAALFVWDRKVGRRARPETTWGGWAILGLNVFALPFAQTDLWLQTARWLMSLTGPP